MDLFTCSSRVSRPRPKVSLSSSNVRSDCDDEKQTARRETSRRAVFVNAINQIANELRGFGTYDSEFFGDRLDRRWLEVELLLVGHFLRAHSDRVMTDKRSLK